MKYNCKECDFKWEGTVNTFEKVREHEKKHLEENKLNILKDDEFKLQISTEDINKIDDEVRGMSDSSKSNKKSNDVKNKVKIINIEKNQDITNGLRLLSACANCENEFIPKNSMINEKLCKSCLEK